MRRPFRRVSIVLATGCSLMMAIGCGTEAEGGVPDAGVGGTGGIAGAPGTGGTGGGGGLGGAAGTGGTGAVGGLGGGAGIGGTDGVHPPGYATAEVHGSDLRLGTFDCRFCHGADLTGGSPQALSCDTCHTPLDPAAWRTDCVFCHGGVENQTGAPPRNLDGSVVSAGSSFPAHDAHVSTVMTEALDCVECHVKATDVLSAGHVFDDTPGTAEVDLGGGRSPRGTYDASTGCASLYCHGDGQGDNGSLATTALPMTCESCHAGAASDVGALEEMSGLHGLHVSDGAGCQDCHQATTADGATIAMPALHINGLRDTQFSAPGFSYDQSEQTCTGTCHGYPHDARPWLGSSGVFHPVGFSDPDVHSPEMELQRMDCRSCHGSDLTGGAGPSCDSCHSPGWRSDCVFCHGADDNLSGAPPRDLGALPMSGSQSFLAHTAHVTEGMSRAFDCTECHVEPTDVLSAGHAFDATPGMGEVTFAMGLSAAGDYDGAGTCSVLYCHGNGRGDNGSVTDGGVAMQCGSCHPGMASSESAWASMSGEHRKHLQESGVTCGTCHLDVTSDGLSIRGPLLHVDGLNQLRFTAAGFSFDGGTKRCSGTCHGERHDNDGW